MRFPASQHIPSWTWLRNVSLTDLHTFVALVKLRSFTDTATAMHISQPAVTQRIRRLEKELGSVLLIRKSGTVELTSTGIRLVEGLEPALEMLSESIKAVSRTTSQGAPELIVATTPYIAFNTLPRLMRSFQARHSGARIALLDLNYNEVLHAVESGSAHLGVVADLGSDKYGSELIGEAEVVIAAPPTHPLASLKKVSVSDLEDHVLFLNSQYIGLFEKIESFARGQPSTRPPKVSLVQQMATLVGIVNASLGLALVTRVVAEEHCSPNTAVLKIDGVPLTRQYFLLKSHRSSPTKLVREFGQHLREEFSDEFQIPLP